MNDNTVYLKDCLKETDTSEYSVPIVLGRDSEEDIIVKDLVDIPNILMAGATGTGKSVFLTSVIFALLKNKTPEELKFVMIDPKQVELPFWNGIPHLLHEPITDMKEASAMLDRCIKEMEYRDKKIMENKRTLVDLPFIVILVDEFADLMLYDESISKKLCKLAKRGYLVNIDMILSSSAAWEKVFTKELKELIPGRLAGALPTEKESRNVLDSSGAEELLGNGDMIYVNTNINERIRVQTPFVKYEECKLLKKELGVKEVSNTWEVEDTDIFISEELLERAERLKEDRGGNINTYILQRELKIGYRVAKKVVEEMED
jgi:S-DNA-T family DNA segregation ATPase FtsK/SpoIIIE